MSADGKHEIVIIRRGGHGDHYEHHGGVWKIAFADFMTAMMAFFLVMWLISANDKTRASVARYFNPVRLVDATTQPRGLHDPKKDESGITASPDSKETKGDSKDMTKDPVEAKPDGPKPNETPAGREKRLDSTLRDNPFRALAEIAAVQGVSDAPPKEAPRTSVPVIGRRGGAEFRDPFAPPAPSAPVDTSEVDFADVLPPRALAPPSTAGDAPTHARAAAKAANNEVADAKAAKDLLSSLAATKPDSAGPGLDVKKTSEGLLVSLTDTGAFSMFTNGSAVPERRVVLMMERVAKVLATKPGVIVIRGFTDNKRYRSKRYDNWNLSVDRAQAAHYMLVRGGLSDARIASVEGCADHGSKPGVDPASPLNRRIEILLKEPPR